jgi:hypothetical protein
MMLPAQSSPVGRRLWDDSGGGRRDGAGVEASQTSCDGLTGLAQQMCYAVSYGVY